MSDGGAIVVAVFDTQPISERRSVRSLGLEMLSIGQDRMKVLTVADERMEMVTVQEERMDQ